MGSEKAILVVNHCAFLRVFEFLIVNWDDQRYQTYMDSDSNMYMFSFRNINWTIALGHFRSISGFI